MLDNPTLNNANTSEIAGNTGEKKTLQDLYRPPIDITYKGTFEAVSKRALFPIYGNQCSTKAHNHTLS